MKVTATVVKLGVFSCVLLIFTAVIFGVFGQVRFDRTVGYSAIFKDASGLRAGQFVRASGVEIGKIRSVHLIDNAQLARVDFSVDGGLQLTDSTTAQVRYADLIGNRYLEIQRGISDHVLDPGGTIPLARTVPALDLDALIGGFRPLFRALDPKKVNDIASSIITALQGQGGTIADVLDQTAQLTSTLADRDHTIGDVITNLNTVLDTAIGHQTDLDSTVVNLQMLISGLRERAEPIAEATARISRASGTLADLLADNRPALTETLARAEGFQQPLLDQRDQLDDLLTKLPDAFEILGRSGGLYGNFFNFYLCDLTFIVNGLQPGGPVRKVRVANQTSGRCTPQ
ncbi:MCE family protein [Mycolicibacterium septicum DSM 44393]|uniref:MCE family protein n=1 Tax=Mycolicibacterium septicum DSM 44393 TaxID=1341646 RepID=A0A7X6MMX8_9MYCO|nr:MCE family protein [Mycolicibacterium septicum]NKZ10831.1 MCE family protein [Mycolicibacterium septicum DSM 44393]